MRVALITVYSRDRCTMKDVAGGFGTVFDIGSSLAARVLERAKSRLARIPSPVLGTLAALARRGGHEVVPVELATRDAGSDELPRCDVALVLTSMVDASAEREVLHDLSSRGVHTVAFGAHASARPDAYLGAARVVVRGEPEALGDALCDRSARGLLDAGFVEDLDALPLPDWRGFAVESYRYGLLARGGVTLPVLGSRGCARGCGYCPFRTTAPFRQRRPERVVEEVRRLREEHGARGIAFRDPLFNHDRERLRVIARGLAPLDVRFSAEMHADLLDEALLRELRDAGLRSLELGVESVDRDMLARHGRQPPTSAQIERVIAAAHELGVRVIANFLLGLPGDSEANIRDTVAWAKRLNTFAVQFTVATPYPGTALRRRVRGLAADGPDAYTGWEPLFDHPELPRARLRELREWAYVSYHARPRYLAGFARQAARALVE